MVQVVADLEPVPEYGHGYGSGREFEPLAAEFGNGDGEDYGYEEAQEGFLQ